GLHGRYWGLSAADLAGRFGNTRRRWRRIAAGACARQMTLPSIGAHAGAASNRPRDHAAITSSTTSTMAAAARLDVPWSRPAMAGEARAPPPALEAGPHPG